MMPMRGYLCCCTLVIGLLACGSDKSVPASGTRGPYPDPNALKKISDRLETLEKANFETGYKIQTLMEQVGETQNRAAYVNTEEDSYSVARTQFGPFIVLCRGVTPYLDGFKVKLAIGNITSAQFVGAKLNLSWGVVKIGAEERNREITVTSIFNPGAYSQVEVVLTPAKAEDVKWIKVGISLNQISLR